MVRGDVEQDGDVGAEVIHIVQLEAAQLDDVVFVRVFCNLQGKAVADVPGQPGIIACIREDMIDEACRGRFPIAARDADHLGIGIPAGEFNLADNVCALFHEFSDHRGFFGNARALDDLVGIEDFLFRMVPLFPFDAMVVEQLLVFVLDGGHIGNEHIESFLLCQYGCTGSALAGTQYYDSFHISFPFLNSCFAYILTFPANVPGRREYGSQPLGTVFPGVGNTIPNVLGIIPGASLAGAVLHAVWQQSILSST